MTDQGKAGFDQEVDLLVFGAGAGGMTAALVGALSGLDVLLCEKTTQVGGNTSTSGGTTWVPGNSQGGRVGAQDSLDDAAAFLRAIVGDRGGDDVRAAFLESGRSAIDELEQKTEVKFAAAAAHPDYLDGPGSAFGGRALGPLPFDGRLLGADFARVRPPRPEFMGLGGMMVGRAELAPLLQPFASLGNLKLTLGIVGRYALDRLRYRRGTRLLMGNALVARLFYSLRLRKVPVLFETPLRELLLEQGKVVGAVVDTPQGQKRIRARRGVVLATGGVAWNEALRKQYFPPEVSLESQAPETNTGDGIVRAMQAGAAFDDGHDSPALWMPCSFIQRADGTRGIWPHILLDRAKPGLIAVGRDGRRFVNESDSYHDFCMGMLRHGLSEAWLVCDADFIKSYGLGLVMPGGRGLAEKLRKGYLTEAPTLEALAAKVGLDADAFRQTVKRYNEQAQTGVDADFGRGTSAMNRFNGDETQQPNPCLRRIREQGPYYALRVVPMDLACSAGLRGDVNGQVLDQQGRPIEGLYACGNDLTSLFRGTYPGPGTTIGPAMVFAWRIAKHAARKA
ncbi:FAD-binding protein [Kerstersia gyiorum]|jgi:succinate dehydrogenase/fumarate reductase flavoprotein subunit|uniref:FAD-binding protein n=1 Tax=Kerstersia gyiorum TaxID=206506 RepID=UPI002433046B|nr:FAD-binding protein [Kerstersia gyiorum]MCH4270669.1 FAD-binding protein [Kerstersia gyiorum]MCI1230137.1 FAD-binding protein [Kerstersia gyiorum]